MGCTRPSSANHSGSLIVNELIALFDGPAQREADRLAAEAFGEVPDSINYH
jgi:hypothetical protein